MPAAPRSRRLLGVKADLTRLRHFAGMVTHRRRRTILTALCLYTLAACFIGYFGVNAFTGNHGLKAKHDLDQQIAELTRERDKLKAERDQWSRRVALLRSGSLDPDMLDERARALLEYIHPNDIAMIRRQ